MGRHWEWGTISAKNRQFICIPPPVKGARGTVQPLTQVCNNTASRLAARPLELVLNLAELTREAGAAELPGTHPACLWHRDGRCCCGAAGWSPGCWVWSPSVGTNVGLVLLLAPEGQTPFPGKFGGQQR